MANSSKLVGSGVDTERPEQAQGCEEGVVAITQLVAAAGEMDGDDGAMEEGGEVSKVCDDVGVGKQKRQN